MKKLIIIFMLLAVPALGQITSVTSSTGEFQSGATVTILGSGGGFGTKPSGTFSPAPMMWDNGHFYRDKRYVDGQVVPVGPTYPFPFKSFHQTASVVIPRLENSASEVRSPGTWVYKFPDGPGGSAGGHGGILTSAKVAGWTVSQRNIIVKDWWVWMEHMPDLSTPTNGIEDSSHATKMTRTKSSASEEWTCHISMPGDYSPCSSNYTESGSTMSPYFSDDLWHPSGVWTHVRTVINSTPAQLFANSGRHRVYKNGRRIMDFNHLGYDLRYLPSEGNLMHDYEYGCIPNTQYNTSLTRDVGTVYFSEIYRDNTLASVILSTSDSFSWANTTEVPYDMQIPSYWADGEIRVTFNAGALADGTAAYLHVFNDVGTRIATSGVITVSSGIVDPCDPVIPAPPIPTWATPATTAGDGTVLLDWNAVAGATDGYRIYIGTSATTWTSSNVTAATEWLWSGLTSGQEYWFKVASRGPCLESGDSEVKSETPTGVVVPLGILYPDSLQVVE